MSVIYLDVDEDGYIVDPNEDLIKGNIILKLKGEHNEIKIGNCFLDGCSGLKELDLSGLKEVKSIGYGFLYRCDGLKELDLSVLKEMKSIGSYFLAGCSRLKELDLSGMKEVKSISYCFLKFCSGLNEIVCDEDMLVIILENNSKLETKLVVNIKVKETMIEINECIEVEI